MDFLDHQAEESEGEGTSAESGSDSEPVIKKRKTENADKKTKKLKKKKSRRAQVQSDDDDDDEEDDDDEGRKEMGDFITDEVEEDDKASEKSEDKEDVEEDLDDDDLDLINENLDLHQNQRKNRVQLDDSDEENMDDRTAIQKNLFGDGDDDAGSEAGDQSQEKRGYRSGGESDSERSEDNFIEDDGDGPPRHRHRHKHADIPEGAADDARDIFGVEDFNFDEFYDEDEAEEGMDEEEEEIIEEDGEGNEIRVRRQKQTIKKSTLLDAMEPSELERGFLSAADKKIMMEDVPERFQLRKPPVTEVDDDELEAEAKWILQHAFITSTLSIQPSLDDVKRIKTPESDGYTLDSSTRSEVAGVIKEVIRLMRSKANLYEVPFIAYYRKETLKNFFTTSQLWRIYDYDEKWCRLTIRKKNLETLMRKMQMYQEESGDVIAARRPIGEYDIMEIQMIDSQEHLSDFHKNFQLLYGSFIEKQQAWEKERAEANGEEVDDTRSNYKQSSKFDKYNMCIDNGISELSGRFGLTAKQFAENLDWKKHDVEQDSEPPSVAAEAYICNQFPTIEVVLEGAKWLLAKEISLQSQVRDKVRELYRKRAMIWVRPTKKGREVLDESHHMWNKRYIREKPVTKLEDDEFLWYHTMEQSGLVTLEINCDTEAMRVDQTTLADNILQDQPFHRDEYSTCAEEWNKLRVECVRLAIDEMILPAIRDEIRAQLLDEAKQCVVQNCVQSLRNRIGRAGFVPEQEEYDDDDYEFADRHGKTRLMAIVYPTDRNEASFGVMVNENGIVTDYVRMVHLTKKGRFGNDKALKNEALEQFKSFVKRRRPHAIGLNVEDMDAMHIKRDLEAAINDLVSEQEIAKPVPIFLMDNEAAKVYMASKSAVAEYPDYPPALRQAVSLARLLLDPVIEYTHLWNVDEDFFCLAFHPLQRDVDQELLVNGLSHEIIDQVNQVGVDINRCIEFPHYTGMLQFVCGLGPRKATHMLKKIKAGGSVVENRTKLVTMVNLGSKVFMNCAGFLKIDAHKIAQRDDIYVEILDVSRVHPETYEWARKMAVDALEFDDSSDPSQALVDIMDNPDRLKDLDLDAFADELNRQGFGEKKATLYDIASELSSRFKDRREEFADLSNEKVYDIIARQTKPIRVGQMVVGTVFMVQYKYIDRNSQDHPTPDQEGNHFRCPLCKQYTAGDPGTIQEHIANESIRSGGCPGIPMGVKVRIDGGMTGFVPNKNISKDRIDNPLKRVKLNQPYNFKVMNVEKERMSCVLSCKSSDLQSNNEEQLDPYWDSDMFYNDNQTEEDIELRKKEERSRVKRVIAHPDFKNISYEEATKVLDDMDETGCVVRPSAHKDNSISVTWKICNGVYNNFFVSEKNKDQVYSLGKTLIVGKEEFEDLNELIARLVRPMQMLSKEIVNFKYFYDGAVSDEQEKVEAHVREQRAIIGRLPYVLTASKSRPCMFAISYMFDNSGRVRHEYFKIDPHGLRYRKQMFHSLDQMIDYFKKHYHEPPDDSMVGHRTHHIPPSHHQQQRPQSVHHHHMQQPAVHGHHQPIPANHGYRR